VFGWGAASGLRGALLYIAPFSLALLFRVKHLFFAAKVKNLSPRTWNL